MKCYEVQYFADLKATIAAIPGHSGVPDALLPRPAAPVQPPSDAHMPEMGLCERGGVIHLTHRWGFADGRCERCRVELPAPGRYFMAAGRK